MNAIHRLLTAATLLTFAASAPRAAQTPPGEVKPLRVIRVSSQGTQTYSTGPFTFTLSPRAQQVSEGGRLVVTFKKKEVKRQNVEPATTLTFVDLNRDGTPEAVLRQFSGGAHCCCQHTVFSVNAKTGKLASLLDWDGQDVCLDAAQYQFLGSGKYAEIVTADARFRYFSDLPFAYSPMVTRVFTLRSGRYVTDTKAFPKLLRTRRANAMDAVGKFIEAARKAENDLAAQKTPDAPEAQEVFQSMQDARLRAKGAALEATIYGILLGEQAATVTRVKSMGDSEASAWLETNLPDILKLVKESPL